MQRTAFIRKYNPDTDFRAAIEVFRETCDESLRIEPLWTIGSYIWCRPYLMLSPESCLVVDDGDGKVVGYIIGTSNSDTFCERWLRDFVPQIDHELSNLPGIHCEKNEAAQNIAKRSNRLLTLIRRNPRKLVLGDYPEDLRRLGHLHIDILPSHQRQGFGKKLVKTFCSAAKGGDCQGIYLGMSASNHGAARFYESCGFGRLHKVLDEGQSGRLGRTAKSEDGGETIYFVQDV